MEKFNLWKFDPNVNVPPTGGWAFVGVVTGLSAQHVLSSAAQTMKIKKIFLKVYPHIDSMPDVSKLDEKR